MKDELDDLLANELPAKDLDYLSPQNSYTHCRMAIRNKLTEQKTYGNWIDIDCEKQLEIEIQMRGKNTLIEHWIERTTF